MLSHRDHPYSASQQGHLSGKDISAKAHLPFVISCPAHPGEMSPQFLSISELKGQLGVQTPGHKSWLWFCSGFISPTLILWGFSHFKALSLSEATEAKGKTSGLMFGKQVNSLAQCPEEADCESLFLCTGFLAVSAGREVSKSREIQAMGLLWELRPFEYDIALHAWEKQPDTWNNLSFHSEGRYC